MYRIRVRRYGLGKGPNSLRPSSYTKPRGRFSCGANGLDRVITMDHSNSQFEVPSNTVPSTFLSESGAVSDITIVNRRSVVGLVLGPLLAEVRQF